MKLKLDKIQDMLERAVKRGLERRKAMNEDDGPGSCVPARHRHVIPLRHTIARRIRELSTSTASIPGTTYFQCARSCHADPFGFCHKRQSPTGTSGSEMRLLFS
jgi:hypothetical protein